MDPLGEPVGPGEPAQRGHPVPAVPLALVAPLVQQVRFRARQDRAGRVGQSVLQAQFQDPRGHRVRLARAVHLDRQVVLVAQVEGEKTGIPDPRALRVRRDPVAHLVHPGRRVLAVLLVEPGVQEASAARAGRVAPEVLVQPAPSLVPQVRPAQVAHRVLPVQVAGPEAPVAPEEPVESVPQALRPGLRVRVGHLDRQAQQAELVGPEALEALAQQARRLAHLGRPVPRDRVDLPAELEAPAGLGEQVELAEPEVSELRAQRQALLGQVVLAARLVRPGVQAEPAEQVAPARLEPPAQHRGRQVRLDHQGQAAHPVHQGLPARPAERVALAVLGARAEPAELARPARPRDDSSASRSSPPQTPASTLSTAPPEPSSSPPTGRVPAAAVSLAPRAVARGRAEARPAQSWS